MRHVLFHIFPINLPQPNYHSTYITQAVRETPLNKLEIRGIEKSAFFKTCVLKIKS
jgi:hypothetical protein